MAVSDEDLAGHIAMVAGNAASITLNVEEWHRPADARRTRRDWSQVAASPDLPAAIKSLELAEANARMFRLFLESLRDGTQARTCESCGREMYGRADRRYCSGACRQLAYRAAHSSNGQPDVRRL